MADMSVSGLLTGFDTKAVVDKLMAVERLAGNRLTTAKTGATALSGVLTQLNGLTKSMGDAAKVVVPDAIMKTSIWTSSMATSSDSAVASVKADGISQASTLAVTVKDVAAAGSVVTGEIAATSRDAALSATPWALSITNHGVATPLSFSATDSINTVAAKINGTAALDMTASVVQVRDGVFRLQLTSKTTGADTTLAVTGDTATLGGVSQLATGKDTDVSVGAGTPGEFHVTSKTNQVTGLMDGLTLTALKQGATTISAQRDSSAIASKVQAMVEAANAALTNVRINSKVDPNLAKAVVGQDPTNNSGLLLGNSTAQDVTRRISDVFVGSSTNLPSLVGINIAKDGTVSFDKAKFTEAYAKDPAAVEKSVTQTAQKLADVSDALTSPAGGTLTAAIQGQDALVKDYTDQIKRFEDRMTAKQDLLNRQYDALDKMLSKLKTQGDWLTGQLNALNGTNAKK